MLYLNEDTTSHGPKAGAVFLQPPSCCYGQGASTELRAPSKPGAQHDWTWDWQEQLRSCSGVTIDSSGRWSAQHAAAKKPKTSWASWARMLRTRQRASFCLSISFSVPCLASCKLFWFPCLRKDSADSGRVKKRSAKLTKGMEQLRRHYKGWDCPVWRGACGGGRCLSNKILWNHEDMKIRWMQSCSLPNPATSELRCTQWNFKG